MELNIKVQELADFLGIRRSTLNSWLDHYTLFKFIKPHGLNRQREINCTQEFYENFKRYLTHKHPRIIGKDYYYYPIRFEEFINLKRGQKCGI